MQVGGIAFPQGTLPPFLRRQLKEKSGYRSTWAGGRKASGCLILVSWNRGRIIC